MSRFLKSVSCEYQYLNLIKRVVNEGSKEIGRNGTVYSTIGESMRFSLENDKLPLLTTKYVPWKVCLKELFWFMHGKTDNRALKNQNVKITSMWSIINRNDALMQDIYIVTII